LNIPLAADVDPPSGMYRLWEVKYSTGSEDDLSELPSPKIHVFSKKTLHDGEQPVKTTKDKMLFH
jgi:hypothetical protein